MRSSTIGGRGERESDDADMLASWFEAGDLIHSCQVEPASYCLLVGLGALAGGCPLALRLHEPIVVESIALRFEPQPEAASDLLGLGDPFTLSNLRHQSFQFLVDREGEGLLRWAHTKVCKPV